ncbi:PAP fibrillin [Aureococcus anophagefferens]|nr:PAP fibrillin [Aureococcus anophagefferens]
MTAAVLLRRSLVDKQMVDTEATIKSYEARQDDTKAQIIRRRNAQAEVYAFVNKRLEENFDSIAQLETSINAAEAEGREARRRFAEEEAAARSANAKEIHAHDGEVERCDGERKALEAFAAERAASRPTSSPKMLTREAAEAAAQARKVALEDAKQKLDKTTRRRIGELSRMKKELALHASESAKLETANAALKAKVDALSASLRSDFEVAALFVAAKHALPPAPRPRTQQIALPKTRGSSSRTPKTRAPRTAGASPEANKLPRPKRDDFVELLFSHLYQMQQIQFQEQAEAERRAELLARARGPPLVDGSVADSLSVLSSATEKFGFDEASLGSASSTVEERSYMSQSLDEGHSVGELDVDSLVKGAEKTALLRGHTPGSPLGSKRDKPPPGHSKLASSS